MRVYNMHEAKTQLSRLVREAALGEPFVIARAGRGVVKVMALDAPEAQQVKRFGFLAGQLQVPEDFNTRGADEIDPLFWDGE